LNIPFSAYRVFVIEEKYGFNKTTLKTFLFDILKSWLLSALIGGLVFACVLWIFEKTGDFAWLLCWAAISVFYLFLAFIAPAVIMPLFNKFIPVEDGELKNALENYAKEQSFKMKGLFKMDGSKRSTKSNAFFTGFGKYRRIVLFDTLIEKHTVDELVSVLAHEMGHFKLGHIYKSILLELANTGLMLFILSFFVKAPGIFEAFKMRNISVYAGMLFFGFLYSPVNTVVSIAANILSRKHENEADRFSINTYKKPEAMIEALKKLTVDNLSNLTPHPLKVFLEYSHPPVLERIRAIREINIK
jgi:STE24 endopeptidase